MKGMTAQHPQAPPERKTQTPPEWGLMPPLEAVWLKGLTPIIQEEFGRDVGPIIWSYLDESENSEVYTAEFKGAYIQQLLDAVTVPNSHEEYVNDHNTLYCWDDPYPWRWIYNRLNCSPMIESMLQRPGVVMTKPFGCSVNDEKQIENYNYDTRTMRNLVRLKFPWVIPDAVRHGLCVNAMQLGFVSGPGRRTVGYFLDWVYNQEVGIYKDPTGALMWQGSLRWTGVLPGTFEPNPDKEGWVRFIRENFVGQRIEWIELRTSTGTLRSVKRYPSIDELRELAEE
jgi:hypothetical protein